jgi:hypothetical protein
MFTSEDQLPQKPIIRTKPDHSLELKRFFATTSAAIFHQGVRSDCARAARIDSARVMCESTETGSTKVRLAARHLAAASVADRRVDEMKKTARQFAEHSCSRRQSLVVHQLANRPILIAYSPN